MVLSCYLRVFLRKVTCFLFLNVHGGLVVQVRSSGIHFCVMYVPEDCLMTEIFRKLRCK